MSRSPREQQRDRPANTDATSKSQDASAARRKTRVPLGVPRAKLSVPQRPGYVRRWINDDGGRLQNARDGDWQFVEDPDLRVGDDGEGNSKADSRVSRIVGKKRDGRPLRAFLMEIEESLYQADQKEKARALDETERQIKRGSIRNDRGDTGYVPKGGISIKSGQGRVKQPGGEAEAAEE